MVNYLREIYFLYTLMRHCYWEPKKLAEYQTREFKRIINYAYENVPFWRSKLDEIGLTPSEVKSLKDLNKLPIIRKEDVKRNLGQMVSREFGKNELRMLSTSGSTGQPLHFYINSKEDEFRKARHLRANISCGQKLRDRWVTVTSPHLFEQVGKLQRLLRIYTLHRISVFLDVSKQVLIVERLKPDVLEGYASSLLLLAKEVDRLGLKTIRPRLMFSGAELIDDHSRNYIEQVFGAPLYDHYATIEFERMAWQCSEKMGYHIDADSIIMQFVDENGKEVAPGERGEVVCTSLFNYAMPFIRYAVGDIGIPSDEKCSCGRSFPLMKILEGRTDSILRFPDGRMVSPRIFTVAVRMFDLYSHIDQFRVVQKDSRLIEFLIKMKDSAVSRETLAAGLEAHVKRVLQTDASGVEVAVKFVKNIPLDKSGKLMAVVSEVQRS